MSSPPLHTFELILQVRDYECDLQGIVNHAVYLHYLEHARHEFIKTAGLDFWQLHRAGYDGVVVRAEVDYKLPLRPGDRFAIRMRVEPRGLVRFIFYQDIYRLPDERLVVRALVHSAFLQGGKPVRPPAAVIQALTGASPAKLD